MTLTEMSFGGPNNSVVRDFVGGVRAASYWIGNRLLSASDIANDSSVTGSNVKAAINTLNAKTYAASQVTNDSSVSGSSVKDALNTLTAAIPSGDTLITGGTITPATYATTTTTMTPASFFTFTPTAAKLYRMEMDVIGNLTSGAAQGRLQVFDSSGSGTYSFVDVHAGHSASLPYDIGQNGGVGTSVFLHHSTLYFSVASTSSLILGFRFKNSSGSLNYSLALGRYAIYEVA